MSKAPDNENSNSLRPYYTAIYYSITIPLLIYVIVSKKFRGGPCTPGEDIMLALLFGVATLVMFSRGLYKIYNATVTWLSFALNILAIVIWITLVFFYR
ncbi:hypothetical protein [Desertivirga arenae]|uniref:hypothetical protein n=1 Tax=Desertivirga arenae TaxID=2810309 RepID=UPI001A9643BC|nr:hypothetical protein [Pedobacter sp. SYSU D00823]